MNDKVMISLSGKFKSLFIVYDFTQNSFLKTVVIGRSAVANEQSFFIQQFMIIRFIMINGK